MATLAIDAEYDGSVNSSSTDAPTSTTMLSGGSSNARCYFRFPLSGLPAGADVTDVTFQINQTVDDVDTDAADTVDIRAYSATEGDTDPEGEAAATKYSNCIAGTSWVNLTGIDSTGSKTADLGATADAVVEGNISSPGFVSVALGDGTLASAESATFEAIENAGTDPPTITVVYTAAVVVTPGVLALVTTLFAPIIKLAIIIPVKALTITSFAPTVTAPRLVTPTTAALTTARFAPSIIGGKRVTPTTASLTTTKFAPTVSTPRRVTPTTASLTTNRFAPVIKHQIIVPVKALTTSRFAPSVRIGVRATPPTASLTTAKFAPTVSTPRLVTPSTKALVTSTFAPTVTATSGQNVTPTTASLTTATFIPTVTVEPYIQIARPNSTVQAGNWTTEGGAADLDDATKDQSDSTYAQLLDGDDPSTMILGLGTLQNPVDGTGLLRIRLRRIDS